MRVPDAPALNAEVSDEAFRRALKLNWSAHHEYLHWDKIRYKSPPNGWSKTEYWHALQVARRLRGKTLPPLREAFGGEWFYTSTAKIEQELFSFDRIRLVDLLHEVPEGSSERYRLRDLVEEAIASSELEGARPTTRAAARRMLREKRTPVDKNERMIFNNWNALQWIKERVKKGERITAAAICELHRVIGENALDVKDAAGVFRTAQHDVFVADQYGKVLHEPPPADATAKLESLPQRVERLAAFASIRTSERLDTTLSSDPDFLHPTIRAILSHFWLCFEHPFRDGNGRVARALFYWVMLRNGFEFVEYLSLSKSLRAAPIKYGRSFRYVETDPFDTTYFIEDQLRVLKAAHDDFREHLTKGAARFRHQRERLQDLEELNRRQRQAVDDAIGKPSAPLTLKSHAGFFDVSYQTARNDLLELEARGIFRSYKRGRTLCFVITDEALAQLAD